jgi:hypothetical protein
VIDGASPNLILLAHNPSRLIEAAALAVPLMLRKVPPNVVYGYRTRATLRDERTWYEANAHFGRGLLVASAISAALAAIALALRPPDEWLPLAITVFVLPPLIAAIATARYIRGLRA